MIIEISLKHFNHTKRSKTSVKITCRVPVMLYSPRLALMRLIRNTQLSHAIRD